MIYMVDHVYADPASEQAWHEWYAGYLQKLVSVPGIHTAQRFKAVGCTPSRYLAMYSIESEAVYSSDAYKNIGGGGSQSARFHHAYQLWTRNLFEGASRAPVVADEQRVLVFDREASPRPDTSLFDRDVSPHADALPVVRGEGDIRAADSRITSGAPPLFRAGRGEGEVLARAVWLKAVALHMSTNYRAFIVLDADEVATTLAVPGSYIYEPFTAALVSQRA
ncbi:MAG TPA: hypothetical protein VGC70_12145 [Burkholderiales bacterium]